MTKNKSEINFGFRCTTEEADRFRMAAIKAKTKVQRLLKEGLELRLAQLEGTEKITPGTVAPGPALVHNRRGAKLTFSQKCAVFEGENGEELELLQPLVEMLYQRRLRIIAESTHESRELQPSRPAAPSHGPGHAEGGESIARRAGKNLARQIKSPGKGSRGSAK